MAKSLAQQWKEESAEFEAGMDRAADKTPLKAGEHSEQFVRGYFFAQGLDKNGKPLRIK